MTRLFASPTLARWLQSSSASMNARPASRPPRRPNVNTAPAPSGRYRAASARSGLSGRPAYETHATSSRSRRNVGDCARVRDVLRHAQRQRFEPLHQQPGVHRRDRCADVAQHLGARAQQERVLAERLGEVQAVIARARLESSGCRPAAPRELPGLDDHAADHGAVAADELRRGVHDDVGAVLDRPAQVRRRERVVDDQRHAARVRDLGERGEVGDVAVRVADRLGEHARACCRAARRARRRGRRRARTSSRSPCA